MYSGMQVHEGASPITLQIECGPQGDGVQGSTDGKGADTKNKRNINFHSF